MVVISDISGFIKEYDRMTTGDIVSFIDTFEEHAFFMKLPSYLRQQFGTLWGEKFCDISYAYHYSKKYFKEH